MALLKTDQYVLNLNPGHGMQKDGEKGLDGLLYKKCFASYTHLFAPAVEHWAKNFVEVAMDYKNKKDRPKNDKIK